MRKYLDLLKHVLEDGVDEVNERTGEVCRTVIGPTIQLPAGEGFLALTTKKLMFKSVVAELCGFFRGYTNAKDFRELGTRIWDANANETKAWLDSRHRKGEDDLGPIYGSQWNYWEDIVIVESSDEAAEYCKEGYAIIGRTDSAIRGWVLRRHSNQLTQALHKLIHNPTDRRIIISAWNVGKLDKMALPPCHMDYRFVSQDVGQTKRKLSVVMTMRSTDIYLGLPFNIASTHMLLMVMARLANHDLGSVTIQMTNAHVYKPHIEKAYEQLRLEPMRLPIVKLNNRITPVLNSKPNEPISANVFKDIEPSDFILTGYEFHEWDSRAPMMA